ncbi:hypothetical protein VCHA57P527_10262 [Vibrio chagasii]|nr:hypothetical protein VCHA57P527_10262 [Vibrio chagasii]CAH7427050.1 hypothetical protein VCHA48P434_90179 [Vibrio chagasii]
MFSFPFLSPFSFYIGCAKSIAPLEAGISNQAQILYKMAHEFGLD